MLPVLVIPCDPFGVVNMTEPGPTLVVWPSQKISPVPLSTITVDADPTKSDHFRQWATNRTSDPARCVLATELSGVAISLPRAVGESTEFQADLPFTVCGRSRDDGGREHVTGTVVRLEDGWLRVRARIEHFHREAYRIGPRFTEGWLARVQSLAKVVAEEGTLELTLFAAPPEASARPRASGDDAPCVPRPSTRHNKERKCRT